MSCRGPWSGLPRRSTDSTTTTSLRAGDKRLCSFTTATRRGNLSLAKVENVVVVGDEGVVGTTVSHPPNVIVLPIDAQALVEIAFHQRSGHSTAASPYQICMSKLHHVVLVSKIG